MAVEKLKERIRNYEFYKNGKLDIDMFAKSIISLMQTEKKMMTDMRMEFDFNYFQPMCDEISSEILKYSHILVGKSKEEQDAISSKFKIEMIQTNGKNSLAICRGMSEDEFDKVCETTSEQTFLKLLELNANQTNDCNIIEYTNLLAKLQKVSGVSNNTVLKYIQNMPNRDASVISNMQAIYPIFKTLNDFESKNKAEVVESIFFELPSVNDGMRSYIERRDGNFYYIKIDEQTGVIEEQAIEHGIFDKDANSLINKTILPEAIIEAQKDNLKDTRGNVPAYTDTVCITSGRKHEKTYVTFVEDEKEISVRDSKGNIVRVPSNTFDDIKRDFAIDMVFRKINEKRNKLVYANGIANNLDYEQIIEDLSEARLSLTEKDFKSRAASITRDIITEVYESESLQQYFDDYQRFRIAIGNLTGEIVEYSQPIHLIEDSEERDEAIEERKKTKEGNYQESILLRNLRKIEKFVFNARENKRESISEWAIKSDIPVIQGASKSAFEDAADDTKTRPEMVNLTTRILNESMREEQKENNEEKGR